MVFQCIVYCVYGQLVTVGCF